VHGESESFAWSESSCECGLTDGGEKEKGGGRGSGVPLLWLESEIVLTSLFFPLRPMGSTSCCNVFVVYSRHAEVTRSMYSRVKPSRGNVSPCVTWVATRG